IRRSLGSNAGALVEAVGCDGPELVHISLIMAIIVSRRPMRSSTARFGCGGGGVGGGGNYDVK
ncbi:UNVERIFIED_CONTAM: hypothetical protein Sindi_1660600, partial [Sesamum indicum]